MGPLQPWLVAPGLALAIVLVLHGRPLLRTAAISLGVSALSGLLLPWLLLSLPWFVGVTSNEQGAWDKLPACVSVAHPELPAATAGLQTGDCVRAIDSQPVTTWSELVHEASVRAQPGVPLELGVLRSDELHHLELVPVERGGRAVLGLSAYDEPEPVLRRHGLLDSLVLGSVTLRDEFRFGAHRNVGGPVAIVRRQATASSRAELVARALLYGNLWGAGGILVVLGAAGFWRPLREPLKPG